MFRTVVVGCDGSAGADGALELAQRLVDRREGRLVLACAYPYFRGYALPTPVLYASVLAEEARQTLARAEKALPIDLPRTALAVSDTSVARALHDIAVDEDADLIVLGSSHRGAPGRLAGLTTLQRLLHGAPCAVAVAAPGQGAALDETPVITVAYDASAEADAALEAAYALAAERGGRVRLSRCREIFVYGRGYFPAAADDEMERALDAGAQEELDAAAARAPSGVGVETELLRGTPVGDVLCADAAGSALLVAGSRSYGPLHRLVAGSVSVQLALHATVPILILPRGAQPPAPRLAETVTGVVGR